VSRELAGAARAAIGREYPQQLIHGIAHRDLRGVDAAFGIVRRLVGITDAGEALDLAAAGLDVQTLGITVSAPPTPSFAAPLN
jgi:hypothetical protein